MYTLYLQPLAKFRHIVPLLLGLWFIGCAQEQMATDTTPPPSPAFVARSADTALVETGIDAVPEGNWIFLAWLPSEAEDLAGYRLYRQVDSLNAPAPDLIVDLSLEEVAGHDTITYLDMDPDLAPDSQSGLSNGYYYWVSAYDDQGNESPWSPSSYYKLMLKPSLYAPVQQDSTWLFGWSYTQMGLGQHFIIRLFRAQGSAWIPLWVQEYTLQNPLEVTYPDTLSAGDYHYQVDVVGATPEDRPSGGENQLAFSIN